MHGRFSSFLWGGLVGFVLGVLYAPRSGEETRDQLRRTADEFYNSTLQNYESQKDRVLEAVDVGRKTMEDKAEELKGKLQETREQLKEQVDTAAEAARTKINQAAEKLKTATEKEKNSAAESDQKA